MRPSILAGALVVVFASLPACGAQAPDAGPATSTRAATPAATTRASSPIQLPVTTRSTTTPPAPTGGELPDDLVPNVVEDECLLTPAQFGGLVGRAVGRAENTELAGTARRSCFYAAGDEPLGRIDVYAPAATSAAELVTRITANSTGARPLAGIGQGCAVVPGQQGSFELVVASASMLLVLTLQPGAVATPPADPAWSAAASAMLTALPA